MTSLSRQATPSRRWRRWLAGAAACLCLRLAAADPEAGLPFVTTFEPAEYQGHTQVWSAIEDSKGLLYFGNYDAVLVYDGSRWGRIAVTGGTFVRGLALDDKDALWIGAVDELGYATVSADGSRRYVSLKDKLPPEAKNPGEIWRVQAMPGGALFQSNGWLLYWKDDHFLTLALPSGGSWQMVRLGQETWITSSQQGWYRIQIGVSDLTLEPLPPMAGVPQMALGFALPLGDGHSAIVGGLRHGLFFWDGKTLAPFKTDADDALVGARPYRGTRLSEGRIAVATLQDGAFVFDADGHLLWHLNAANGLSDETVGNVMADSRGALWLCTERGIARVDARPWLTWFGPANGAPKASFDAPVRLNGHVYVATTVGLSELIPATGMESAKLSQVPALHTYLNFAQPAEGGLLCGGEAGLYAFKDGKVTDLPGDPQNVFSMSASRTQPGRWFAMADDGFLSFRFENGAWIAEGPIEGLSHIRSAYEDSQGTWWLGTPTDGVFMVRFPDAGAKGPGKPQIRPLGAKEGIPDNAGWMRVVSWKNEPLLLGERGLFAYNAQAQRFELASALGSAFVDGSYSARAETDSPQGLWIAAKKPGTTELVSPVTLGLAGADGWRAFDLPEIGRLDDVSALRYEPAAEGRPPLLWVGGHGGLIRIDLSRGGPHPQAPRIAFIAAESSDGKALPLAGGWDLTAKAHGLVLHFAAPDLMTDPRLSFETVLEQGSNRSVERGASPDRTFSALATGSYTLTVRAKGTEDLWTEPLVLSFEVEPPWWLGPWASAGYVLIGLLSVTAIIRQRTATFRQRAEELERLVALRTEELRRKNIELARLHQLELDEKIAARLSEAKARLELLRYQLNPHFLMNAFTALRSLVFSKPADAGEMVGKLADFCRIALTRTDETGGTVADETHLIETYLATEKARWRQELQVEVIVEPVVLNRKLPPFLLQPLVENAIKYGGRTSASPLQVEVKIAALGPDGIKIEVNNSGQWLEPGDPDRPDSTGIGLENLRQRLAKYYPEANELGFAHADGWVRVTLELAAAPRDPFATAPLV